MKKFTLIAMSAAAVLGLSACASPPKSDGSKVDLACAQKCSDNLTTCSSGFKLFPVVAQGQCNDAYDVCIQACPERAKASPVKTPSQGVSDRLKEAEDLFKSGVITKPEYEQKRQEILKAL
jgi:hypothetical protein